MQNREKKSAIILDIFVNTMDTCNINTLNTVN